MSTELLRPNEPPPYQFYKEHLPPQIEIFGGPNFFPDELCSGLAQIVAEMPERKQRFDFTWPDPAGDDVPGLITEAAHWANKHKTPVNTAILKRYVAGEDYQSRAYELHQDPEEFGTQRLVLVTLFGDAELTAVTGRGDTVKLPCGPRGVVFLAPEIAHSITEPLNPGGVRYLLFMGFRSPVNAAP